MSIFNKHAHQERPYIVIVDIDGTISEATEDRLHLLPPPGKGALTKDWNEFNLACDTDTPITPVIDMVRQLFNVYTVWFVTGRCEISRDKTRAWLRKYVTNGAEPLLSMRPATDDRNDGPAKIDLLKKIGLSKIAFALEDKIEVARVFRRYGVLTLMVREYENALLHQHYLLEFERLASPGIVLELAQQVLALRQKEQHESNTCRLNFEQWLEQQRGKIDVDCGCVSTETFMHWLRVAYEAGNYPDIPDSSVPGPGKGVTCERIRIKPHVYRELVNRLHDTAIKCAGTQQLRERISRVLGDVITPDHHKQAEKSGLERCHLEAALNIKPGHTLGIIDALLVHKMARALLPLVDAGDTSEGEV